VSPSTFLKKEFSEPQITDADVLEKGQSWDRQYLNGYMALTNISS
jgi:hypothetical protein